MKYRTLGRTGLKVSEIGFGGWALGGGAWGNQKDRDSLAALNKAIDLGLNFIDTAASYGKGRSERVIARALAEHQQRIYVATKIHPMPGPWPPSPYCKIERRYPEDYLRQKVDERLRNLRTDRIDVLQLHTWTRAWNKAPRALDTLRALQNEGKIRYIGISTPEHDQDSVVDLMREGHVDVVQLIYNIFQQDLAAELLPAAAEHNVGVIVRVPFDEGSLTGKFTKDTQFASDDFRNKYFEGDRLTRTVERVGRIRAELEGSGFTLAQAALKFILAHPAVSTVIPGIRNLRQAEANAAVSDLPELPDELVGRLRKHAWRRGFWYAGK
ncbi:MAG: aldo/keto reductase [Acidiferrobacterales bacterium]